MSVGAKPLSRFKKGVSGNPRGRPRKDSMKLGEAELKSLLNALGPKAREAAKKLAELMLESKDEGVQFRAAEAIIKNLVLVQRELDRKIEGGLISPNYLSEDNESSSSEKPQAPAVLRLSVVRTDSVSNDTSSEEKRPF